MLLFVLFYLSAFKLVQSQNDAKIEFSLVDITIDVKENDQTTHLQAWKSSNNDAIIQSLKTEDYKKLSWVALGSPTLRKSRAINKDATNQIFHYNNDMIYAFVDMLTDNQKLIIVQAIKDKYSFDKINESQVLNLILSRFDCSIKLKNGIRPRIMRGEVKNFYEYPLKLTFDAPIGSEHREIFEKLDESKALDLDLECEIEAGMIEKKQNILRVDFNQVNRLNISEKLFGPASETFVTRKQLSNLAIEMYSNLNIAEEYELPIYQFNEEFIEELIKKAAIEYFRQTPIDEVIQALSKYSTNFDKDLTADVIKKDLGKVYEVNKINDQKHIKLNNEYSKSSKGQSSQNKSDTLKGWFGLEDSANHASSKLNEAQNSGKSLDDQLKILNKEHVKDVQWDIVGDKVIPKSINVAKINKASFSRSMSFTRIRKQSFDALFHRKIILSTLKFTSTPLIHKYPIGTILAVASQTVLGFFNHGKGFGEYLGWYLCDGNYGRPDLKGRVLVGYDSNQKDYNAIGNTGGLSHVGLKTGELPEHTHTDSGHSHYISLISSQGGSHYHDYNDVFWSEYYYSKVDTVDVPMKMGTGGITDYDNVGYQMSRTTNVAGYHNHDLRGQSQTSHASITKTGNNEKHENRPPFYVVAYIIFLG
jgi:microcystin-dependent protein